MVIHDKNKQKRGLSFVPKLTLRVILGATLVVPMALQAAVWLPQELAVVDLVNLQRSFHDLDPVQRDDRLHDSALAHSQSMADYNFFSHTTLAGPNTGSTPGERIIDGGYDPDGWGENIAAGQGRAWPTYNTPSAAIDAAHDVMYGTEDLNEINNFFTSFGQTAFGWDDLGEGVTELQWDEWDDWVRLQSRTDPNDPNSATRSGGWMGSSSHR
ncbi:MAG: CAP domain-containing protein, partial [Candidatus Thiodiazotropha taylori]|nr:CAP domain-containing protein [Candidatus Thiodiazotropha taylori]MCW4292204.1 CAP domain-containing protein [Candidatus Thiodiazotropha taylori]